MQNQLMIEQYNQMELDIFLTPNLSYQQIEQYNQMELDILTPNFSYQQIWKLFFLCSNGMHNM